MTKRSSTDLLEGAYDISSPEDNVSYYKDFAAIYDADFARKLGYIYPRILADYYASHAGPADVPVADIGCGTGLVAEAMALPVTQIEGFDISQDMLDVAEAKNIYAKVHRADLTQPESLPEPRFGAVVSAGTFTHGHLGPEPLRHLLKLAKPNALFCIGVNEQHFNAEGFGSVLKSMEAAGEITRPDLQSVQIYENEDHEHGQDRALILLFRKK